MWLPIKLMGDKTEKKAEGSYVSIWQGGREVRQRKGRHQERKRVKKSRND